MVHMEDNEMHTARVARKNVTIRRAITFDTSKQSPQLR